MDDLYAEMNDLVSDDYAPSKQDGFGTGEGWKRDSIIENDPEIQEIADRDYDSTMGRIIAVNLAHWRKRQQKRTQQRAQNDNLEYPGNVEENIEMANEENGFLFYQGDMILDCELYETLNPGKRCKQGDGAMTRTKRNAVKERKLLWTSRVIPYYVPPHMSHINSNLMETINNIQKVSCLRFVRLPHAGQGNYIEFDNTDGCSSRVGIRYAKAARQIVSIGQGCNHVGTITHELMHALGFFHEQSRDDRDRFVEVKWENILDGFADQFDKYSYKTIDMNVGKNYDFLSIMHYDRRAFTKNGKETIVRIDNQDREFGMPDLKSLSPMDILELNALYDCKTKYKGWTQWSVFSPCNEVCKKERQRYCYNSGNRKACGGKVNAYGVETQVVKCSKSECPAKVDGHWGRWSEWSKCDASCDDGIKKRTRMCNNPEPKHDGKYCPGIGSEEVVCTTRRCNLGYKDTDFETGMGMWKNIGQIQWLRHKGPTKTINTGPFRDHTTNKGYYLYMESSNPSRAVAVIESQPWLTAPEGGQCMKFFYNMYGKTMGSLKVAIQKQGEYAKVVFAKYGNQGMKWIAARVDLDIPQGKKYKIKIIAQIGKKGYSDIAIDDVYIDSGLCFCQDDYVSCSKWKAAGHCKTNPKFMRQHCARSCETCECKDNNQNCPAWAAQPNGCKKNLDYMRTSCKKSCNVCRNTAPTICKDNDETQCPAWAKLGYCSKNPLYMAKNCALSCGKCVCQDKNPRCPEWAQKQECLKNKKWMFDHCVRSCHVCACGDNHFKCGVWAKLGECDKNKQFMEEQCKKSCKKC